MKLYNLKLLLFILLTVNFGCAKSQEKTLPKLELKEQSLANLINEFIEDDFIVHKKENLILLRLVQNGDSFELRIGSLPNKYIDKYLKNKSDNPIGFFHQKNFDVIVFGNYYKSFFEVNSDVSKSFSFLNLNESKNNENTLIPPKPPIIFEPVIKVFIYDGFTFNLERVGRFTLIE